MSAAGSVIVLNGSYGEGGGALVRTALVMSAMTQQPMRIDQVREGTRFPGLDVEDLVLLSALARSCQAETVGAELGSRSVSFLPTRKATGLNGNLDVDRGGERRGPNALVVLSAMMPVLARSGIYSSISTEGETYGFNSLSYDYFANVTVEALRRVGLYTYPDLLTPGFGRESSGEVRLEIEPSALKGIDWSTRGSLRSVHALVTTSGLPKTIADRALAHLKNMASSAGIQMEAQHVGYSAKHTGAFVTVWAKYENGMGGGVAMAARSVRAETVAQAAFDQMLEWMASPATADEFLADQLLLPLVFAEGGSTFSVPRLSPRLLTAIWVVKQFTPIHLTVRGEAGGPGTISIDR